MGETWGRAGASPKGFAPGRDNILITYQAGYCIQNEPQIVTLKNGSYFVAALQPDGTWSQDDGVTYANGTSMVAVTGTPSTGQYSVTAGLYTFATGDNNAAILINYSFIPFDIEQACIEIVSERFKYRNNIGVKSRSMGGVVTDTFMNNDLQPYVQMLLNAYRREWSPC